MRRYVFLDRDGTLVPERPDEQWRGVREVTLLDGVGPALVRLQERFDLVVLTNQYLIDEGVLTRDDYEAQTASLRIALGAEGVTVLDVLHCPHARGAACGCRKPAVGMVVDVVRRHGSIDGAGSVVIGDSMADMGLARTLGLRGLLVGSRPESVPPGVTWVGDLPTAVELLGL